MANEVSKVKVEKLEPYVVRKGYTAMQLQVMIRVCGLGIELY